MARTLGAPACRKSVLLIGNYPPPYGGVPRHLKYLAPYLQRKGWDVQVLSGQQTGITVIDGVTIYKHTTLQVVAAMVRHAAKLKALLAWRYLRVLFNAPKRWAYYAIYLSLGHSIIAKHGTQLISAYNMMNNGPVGELLSKHHGIPLVVTNFGEIYNNQGFFRRHAAITRAVCEHANKLLAMSAHCARSYQIAGLMPEVLVIPYGVDVEEFTPDIDAGCVRARLGWNRGEFIVLFVGRLIDEMGVGTVIDAIPAVLREREAVRFLIVGQKGERLDDALAAATAFPEKVAVEPDVPFEELPHYYAAASVVTAPTRGDRTCGSLACIEAMAIARPVIASDAGGIPEIVVDGETGFIVPQRDAAALADAVIGLAGDRERAERMGAAGRRRVEKLFVERNADERIAALFEQLLYP